MESNQLLIIILVAAFIGAGILAKPLIDLNLWFYRRTGLVKLSNYWQKQIGWWRPAMRWSCFAAGALLLLSIFK